VRDAGDLGARVTALMGSAQLDQMGVAARGLSHSTDQARQTLLARLVPLLKS
jgi:hypothetical protein